MQDAATNLPSPADQASVDVDAAAAAGAGAVVPRLLAFYSDAWSDDGTSVGWRTIAWGLALPDGSAVTIPVDPPARVTLWRSIDDAADALDAYVDSPLPRRWPRAAISPSPDEAHDRASSTRSRGSLDGTAAQPACSLDPAGRAAAGGRPLGRDDPDPGGRP